MSSRQNRNKQKILTELRKVPLVQIACSKAGVSRASYYRWRNEDREFRVAANEAMAEGTDVINDLAESKVIAGMNNGDQKYVFFWLNNRHDKYYLQRGPSRPSNLELLELQARQRGEELLKLIKEFSDSGTDKDSEEPKD